MKQSLYLLLPLLLFIISCGSEPDIAGEWKNGDGNLLTLKTGGGAMLGQEGYAQMDSARYVRNDDTVVVSTLPASDELGGYHNEYVLVYARDTLFLHKVTLFREGYVNSTTGAELSRRLGKPEWRLAFARRVKK